MRIEKHFIADIHESEYNPRVKLDRYSDEYKAIKQSIIDYGFVEPIVVNDTTMACIGGHQRLAVMRDMGEEEIYCNMVHIENPEKEKALCIALNKIEGKHDEEKLNELLNDEKIREFELGLENLDADPDTMLGLHDSDDFDDEYGDDEVATAELEAELAASDDEEPNNAMVIKVGNYKFDTTVAEYEEMIASIRDKGIFEKSEIIEELRRRIFND